MSNYNSRLVVLLYLVAGVQAGRMQRKSKVMKKLYLLNSLLMVLLLLNTELYPQNFTNETDFTKEKPTQYRRGIELQEGYQTYDEYYSGKNLNEEKRSLFPLIDGSSVWTELHPKVPRVDYWGVYFMDEDSGLAVGELGAIIKTTNGGDTWYNIETNYNKTLRTIGSFDGGKIIAAGDSGLIIISTDFGESWKIVQSGTDKDLWKIQMINNNLGWLAGFSSTLLKTTDGGYTWIPKTTPLQGYHFFDVSFLDSSFGYIPAYSSNSGFILRTVDGGENWDIRQAGDQYSLTAIKAITRQKAVALGFAGKHVYTTNGGESWEFITFLPAIGFYKIEFIDTLNGFAVATGGGFKTVDGGLTWEWRPDMADILYDILFINDSIGYHVGRDLIIQKTSDSGQSWNQTIINGAFTDVFFINNQEGWFIGTGQFDSRILYQTTDEGITLIRRDDFPGINPASIYFFDNLTGIIGAQNKIYKTYDGGLTWEEKNINGTTGNTGEFTRLFFINDNIGWALSSIYVVKTIDGGENWQAQLNSIGLSGIHFSDSVNGWVTRVGGGLSKPFKTVNGGETWIEQASFPSSETRDVVFIDSLKGFITRTNNLYKTIDGGVNWLLISDVTNYLYGRFSNFPNINLFLTGGTRTYQSIDAGENWVEIEGLLNRTIRFLRLIQFNKGYGVGDIGLIIKYYDEDIPVELVSLSVLVQNNNDVELEWITATEVNNMGFEVERQVVSKQPVLGNENAIWEKIGFVKGYGTTSETQFYSFVDENLKPGLYEYKLRQIDFDGTYEYSRTIRIEVKPPSQFKLNQNYPNPFNPETNIEFHIPIDALVTLKVYDILGSEVATLVNELKTAGRHAVNFDASSLVSGVYLYKINAGSFVQTRKMILLK